MDRKTDRERVRSAILWYLLTFSVLNLLVWVPFLLHGHPLQRFPLGGVLERFGDLVHFSARHQVGAYAQLEDNDHLAGRMFPSNYPPFGVVVYLFLLKVCAPYAVVVLLTMVLGGVGVACTLLCRRVRRLEGYRWYMGMAIFATGFFGWGTEQVVMRGNIEGLVWIGVCLGAALYARRQYRGAAVAFGISCCLKPYPVLWLALMARHKRYREVGAGLLTAAVISLASMIMIDPNPVRAYHTITGKSNFFPNYIVGLRGIVETLGDHSLFQTMKTIARIHRDGLPLPYFENFVQPNDPLAWKLYAIYRPLAALIGLVILWKVWNKPVLNQIFALACVTTVLPLIAGDYTLTVLLIPMGFFLIFLLEDVAQGRTAMTLEQMLCFLLPCAWIMGTEPLAVMHGVAKCFAILVLLVASIAIPLPSTLFGEVPPSAEVQPR